MAHSQGPINPRKRYDPGLRGYFQQRITRYRFWLRNRGKQWQAFIRNPVALTAFLIILFFFVLALIQPVLVNRVLDPNIYDPHMGFDPDVTHPSLPSRKHIFGTDYQGRDVFSRLALGTRTSLGVGLVSALVGTLVAGVIGVSSGYIEGPYERVMMIFTDVFIMLPPAVVLLIVGMIVELSWFQVGAIYGVFAGLGSFAMMVKVQTQSIKAKMYTQAARVAGGGHGRIIGVHILPNLLAMMAVNMMFIVTGSVMVEAILSYFERSLRFSWGTMIWFTIDSFRGAAEGLQWHVLVVPAAAITLFCGAFHLLARTLNEVTNPRLREQ